jgi:uncharacterized membrane protein YtjA (UPF0391 family)
MHNFLEVAKQGGNMLTWAVIFLVVSLIAGVMGFRGVAGTSAEIAKVLFFIFVILFIVSVVFHLVNQSPGVVTVH